MKKRQMTDRLQCNPHPDAPLGRLLAVEREACAKVCDEKVDAEYATGKVDHNEMAWTQACAIVIRARGEQ
jgi:hypothetical protein